MERLATGAERLKIWRESDEDESELQSAAGPSGPVRVPEAPPPLKRATAESWQWLQCRPFRQLVWKCHLSGLVSSLELIHQSEKDQSGLVALIKIRMQQVEFLKVCAQSLDRCGRLEALVLRCSLV